MVFVVVPATSLGDVRGSVSVLQENVSIFTILRVSGNPNAGGDINPVAIKYNSLSKLFLSLCNLSSQRSGL